MDLLSGEQEIRQLLVRHFPQLSEPGLIEAIAEKGRLVEVESGQVLMEYGSFVKEVPLVIQGSIKVMREGEEGGELLLYFLNAGDTCSVSFTCCMMDKQSSIRTIADEDSLLIAIPVRHIDEWMHAFTSWRNFIMLSYDNRILEMVKTIDSIAFDKLDQRLLSYLEKKAKARKTPVVQATHQEIALDLNASREAISRLLKQLEKMGKVRLGRNQVELL